jgi:N-acetylmuramic acid 6-phosphate etherase
MMASTEDHAPHFAEIDALPTVDAVALMLDGQMAAIAAIKASIAAIAAAADAAAVCLTSGGRVVYAGAGTSGRLGALDGVELGPTFGWPDDRLVYLIAGGAAALERSAEGAEDDDAAARQAVANAGIGAGDVLIGIAASGRTPYTLAAITAARAAGALTIAIANNPGSPLLNAADHALLAATGGEVIAGSTRMQAGTAQKAMLTMVSTAIMIRLGRVYRGLMVDMQISNAKLHARGVGIVQSLTGCSEGAAADALMQADNQISRAVLIALGDTEAEATTRLAAHGGILRSAIEARGSA